MGRVQLHSGDLEGAADSLQDAQAIYIDLDQPAGLTATSLDLALVLSSRGDAAGALQSLRRAEETLELSPHFGLTKLAAHVGAELRGPTELLFRTANPRSVPDVRPQSKSLDGQP